MTPLWKTLWKCGKLPPVNSKTVENSVENQITALCLCNPYRNILPQIRLQHILQAPRSQQFCLTTNCNLANLFKKGLRFSGNHAILVSETT